MKSTQHRKILTKVLETVNEIQDENVVQLRNSKLKHLQGYLEGVLAIPSEVGKKRYGKVC